MNTFSRALALKHETRTGRWDSAKVWTSIACLRILLFAPSSHHKLPITHFHNLKLLFRFNRFQLIETRFISLAHFCRNPQVYLPRQHVFLGFLVKTTSPNVSPKKTQFVCPNSRSRRRREKCISVHIQFFTTFVVSLSLSRSLIRMAIILKITYTRTKRGTHRKREKGEEHTEETYRFPNGTAYINTALSSRIAYTYYNKWTVTFKNSLITTALSWSSRFEKIVFFRTICNVALCCFFLLSLIWLSRGESIYTEPLLYVPKITL